MFADEQGVRITKLDDIAKPVNPPTSAANRSWEFNQAKCEPDELGMFCLDKLECDEFYRLRMFECLGSFPGPSL